MNYQTIKYQEDGRVIRITLNRPDKRNALNTLMLSELSDSLDLAKKNKDACCLVLRGAGQKAFCAGADLNAMAVTDEQSSLPGGKQLLEVDEARGALVKVFRQLLTLEKPKIAALNGHCIAGGLGLMLACDLAIAKQGIKIGTPEVARGLFPFVISALILRTVSRRDAYEMMLLGELMDADRALEIGLVNKVVPEQDFDSSVEAWAAKLSSYSPVVLRMGIKALDKQQGMAIDSAFDYLQGLISMNALLDDAKEGITAFFEKRDPVFRGH